MPKPASLQRLLLNRWSDEARQAALEARRGKLKTEAAKTSSTLSSVAKYGIGGAAIAGGLLTGSLLGAKLASKMRVGGRLVKPGESLLGKVIYHAQPGDAVTPLSYITIPGGRLPLDRIVRRMVRKGGPIKSRIAKAIQKVDQAAAIPSAHYGVGVGGRKVADILYEGRRISPYKEFAGAVGGGTIPVRVASEGVVLKAGKVSKAELSKLKDRLAKTNWDAAKCSVSGKENCEAYARGIGTSKYVSRHFQAIKAGMAGGGAVGAGATGGAVAAVTHKKKKPTANELNAKELISMITNKQNIPALIQQITVRPEVSQIVDVINGGPGSGNYGHRGIPGHRGGSLGRDGTAQVGPRHYIGSSESQPVQPSMTAKERRKNATITARKAEIFSTHADTLEKTKSRWFASDDLNRQIGKAHDEAANYLRRAAEGLGTLKDNNPEKIQDMLSKAAKHTGLASKRYSSAGIKEGTTTVLKEVGLGAVEGALGVPPGLLTRSIGEYAGEAIRKETVGDLNKDFVKKTERIKRRYGYPTGDTIDEALAKYRSAGETFALKHVRPTSLYERGSKKRLGSREREEYEALKEFYRQTVGSSTSKSSRPKPTKPKPTPAIPRRDLDLYEDISTKGKEYVKKYGKKPTASSASEEGFVELKDQPVIHSEISLLIANISGRTRTETLNGREYIVAPVTMIVEGVLNGSKGPLFYPEAEISKDPQAWNGMPIVVNHPMEGGVPVSARSPNVIERIGIGYIFNSRFNEKKLTAEGWFDTSKVQSVNSQILANLKAGKPIELSTGLFTDNEPFEGTWNGKQYTFIARNYRPDHLAILVGTKGACSVRDGCGVLVNETEKSINKDENAQDISQSVAELLANIWSPQARAAAAEARRRKRGTMAGTMAVKKPNPALVKFVNSKGAQTDLEMELAEQEFKRLRKPRIRQPVANVIKKIGNKHCVFSHKGRNLGGCGSMEHAKKRLQQVEYFKHKGGTNNEEAISTEVQNVLGAIRAAGTVLSRVGGKVASGAFKGTGLAIGKGFKGTGKVAGYGIKKTAKLGFKGAKRLTKSKMAMSTAGLAGYSALPSVMRG